MSTTITMREVTRADQYFRTYSFDGGFTTQSGTIGTDGSFSTFVETIDTQSSENFAAAMIRGYIEEGYTRKADVQFQLHGVIDKTNHTSLGDHV